MQIGDAYFQDSSIVWIAIDQTKLPNHFLYHCYGACDWNSTKGAPIPQLSKKISIRCVSGNNTRSCKMILPMLSLRHEYGYKTTQCDGSKSKRLDYCKPADRGKAIWIRSSKHRRKPSRFFACVCKGVFICASTPTHQGYLYKAFYCVNRPNSGVIYDSQDYRKGYPALPV